MNKIVFQALILVSLFSLISCSQNYNSVKSEDLKVSNQETKTTEKEAHRYGGWYCPDNLGGFPAVDIANWHTVPVVNGRMPTKEETQNGTSLIFVDSDQYPDAKPLDLTMPKLASIYNRNTRRDELIIVIQAVNVDNDSIVGFRYLNGGNGSARLDEVQFLTDEDVDIKPNSRFVAHSIRIKASEDAIWDIMTQSEHVQDLEPVFNQDNSLTKYWRSNSNINYHYANSGMLTSDFADKIFGNYYVQNDYNRLGYTEKFLISEDPQSKTSELILVCGPFGDDFDRQKDALLHWAQKVKELSEKG
ncbi:MAG: hypothetical protein AAF587_42670 [Bacteroidota bacterium]